MKKINKINKIIMLIIIISLIAVPVFSSSFSNNIQELTYDVKIKLDDQQLEFKDEMKPFIHAGRTYVPLRCFFESIGYKVDWDNDSSTALIENQNIIAKNPLVEQNVSGTLWLMSAEGKANSYQTFNLAKMMFDKAMDENVNKEKLAVIVDIDDTIIDSTSYTCGIMAGKEMSSKAWGEWIASDLPKALPGSVEFLNYVVENGGEVFYITNRWPEIKEGTLQSLANLNFPLADDEHLFIREANMPSSKESRREKVEKDHKVVLLMGDNLEDFSDAFSPKLGVEGRSKAVDEFKELWGTKFIVLPNPMYGDWDKTIYKGEKGLNMQQMIEKRREVLFNNN